VGLLPSGHRSVVSHVAAATGARETDERPADARPLHERQGILPASAWMVALSVLFAFIPLVSSFGPIVAGGVGGRKAGSCKKAFVASFLPSIIASLVFWLIMRYLMGEFREFPAGMLSLLSDALQGLPLGVILRLVFRQPGGFVWLVSPVLIASAVMGAYLGRRRFMAEPAPCSEALESRGGALDDLKGSL